MQKTQFIFVQLILSWKGPADLIQELDSWRKAEQGEYHASYSPFGNIIIRCLGWALAMEYWAGTITVRMTATSFPNSVAVGATWDPELIKRWNFSHCWWGQRFQLMIFIFTLTYWSPLLTSRVQGGEDRRIIRRRSISRSQIGGGFVQGLMGDDPRYLKAVPCGKHYFANNRNFNRLYRKRWYGLTGIWESFIFFHYKMLIEKDRLPAIMTAIVL